VLFPVGSGDDALEDDVFPGVSISSGFPVSLFGLACGMCSQGHVT
jgi:hypothetical protein